MSYYGTVPGNLPPPPTPESWYELLRLWQTLQRGDGWDTSDILAALDRAFLPLGISPEMIPNTAEEIAEEQQAEEAAVRDAVAVAEYAAFLAGLSPGEHEGYTQRFQMYLDGLNHRDTL